MQYVQEKKNIFSQHLLLFLCNLRRKKRKRPGSRLIVSKADDIFKMLLFVIRPNTGGLATVVSPWTECAACQGFHTYVIITMDDCICD